MPNGFPSAPPPSLNPRGVLPRFELTITRNRSASDSTQVPVPGATVELFGQGATAVGSLGVPGLGNGRLLVYDTGQLTVGATVQPSSGGPELSVLEIQEPLPSDNGPPGSMWVYLGNSSAATSSIPAGTRLLVTSIRPVACSDPLGLNVIGSRLTADSNGVVSAYLLGPARFDYVVVEQTASTSGASTTGSSPPSLSWNHTVTGDKPAIFVGVSWTAIGTEDEGVQSVTVGGTPMTLIASDTNIALYQLVNPPAGTLLIVVTFITGTVKSAVAGAVSYPRVVPSPPNAPATFATDTSTVPRITVGGGAIFNPTIDVVSIPNLASALTLTPLSGQTQLWNGSAGTGSPPRITNGAGSGQLGTGSDLVMQWSLSASTGVMWQMLGAEVRLLPIHVAVDASAEVVPFPNWLDVRNYTSIQAAIDALPPAGGTVFIPAGLYDLTDTLYTPCDRPCHLLGEGDDYVANVGTVLRWGTDSQNGSTKTMLRVRGDHSTVKKIVFWTQYASDPASVDEGAGISIGRRNIQDPHPAPGTTPTTEYLAGNQRALRSCLIEDVAVIGAPGWGIYIPGVGSDEPHAVQPGPPGEGTISFWVDCKRGLDPVCAELFRRRQRDIDGRRRPRLSVPQGRRKPGLAPIDRGCGGRRRARVCDCKPYCDVGYGPT